jgi:hypothetical protein
LAGGEGVAATRLRERLSRRRRAELREVLADGFGKKFFVMGETIGGGFRVPLRRPLRL